LRFSRIIISRCLGFKVSRFLGIKAYKNLGFKIARFQSFEFDKSRYQGFLVSWLRVLKVPRNQCFRISRLIVLTGNFSIMIHVEE
jgi:hypothetical protein